MLCGSAATSDTTAVEAWNQALNRNQELAGVTLANSSLESPWEACWARTVAAATSRPTGPTIATMREILGLAPSTDLPHPARFTAGLY